VTPKIRVINRQRKQRLDMAACRKFAEGALALVRKRATKALLPEEISVYLVSDQRIRGIHRQFLSSDEATDVITFQHGEIFISTETAREHAKRFRTGFVEEIHLYVVHGLLHLAGFEDLTRRGFEEMALQQKEILLEVYSLPG
jgi:probable rRNA maturation factor